jgi:hypothetical protein
MNRTLRLLFGVLLFVTGTAVPARAHRLDEYLQATRIGFERERLQVEINLTPGANIASQIASLIDTNADGVISQVEGAAYVRRVLAAISLSIDGRRVGLRIDGHEIPGPEAMAAGMGTIRIRGSVTTATGAGRHHVAYANSHLPQTSVYLVNALVPSDPRVVIGTPQRDRMQRALELDFDVQEDPAWARAAWVMVALIMLGALASLRRPQALRQA